MILLTQTGWNFNSVGAAAKSLGISKRMLSKHLNGHSNQIHGWKFRKVKLG